MNIILLERIASLGQMGDVVRVRDGYARNFLLPQGKALRATEENRKRFEVDRVQLEARNLERKQEAEQVAAKMNGVGVIVIRQAGETGQLYGSVSTRDIADALTEAGYNTTRNQVGLNHPIKTIGLHKLAVVLHPEVEAGITVNVARSADEAQRQARGEDLSRREEFGEEKETAEAVPEAFFEEGAAPADAPEGGEEEKTA